MPERIKRLVVKGGKKAKGGLKRLMSVFSGGAARVELEPKPMGPGMKRQAKEIKGGHGHKGISVLRNLADKKEKPINPEKTLKRILEGSGRVSPKKKREEEA